MSEDQKENEHTAFPSSSMPEGSLPSLINVIEKSLDLSDGEDAADLMVNIPEGYTLDTGNKNEQACRYTVSVSKERMTKCILENTFEDLWKEVQEAVLEDINKV